MTTIWLDGQWLDRETAKVSVFDHGLLYGDGVFEGMRVYNGKTFRLKEHIDRLYDSAKSIWLDVPMSRAEMMALTDEGVKKAGLKEGYLRHIITRGVGDLGLDPRKCPKASIIIIFDTIKLWPAEVYERGLNVVTAGTPIPHRESLSPRVKSLNYLPHILAKIEGVVAGADEVIMMDSGGTIAEASGMNLFIIKNGEVATPAQFGGILKGVTRDVVIEISRAAGLKVHETMMNRYDLYTADEAFFTGTAAEIAPIAKVDGRVVGNGPNGPVTRDLTRRFRELTRG